MLDAVKRYVSYSFVFQHDRRILRQTVQNSQLSLSCASPVTSGVTIGRARRAVHAGPALWGGGKICPTLFFLSFFGEEGALLEYLHAGPLQPCYATDKYY